MGVINITPDSFSDGGQFFDTGRAIAHAHELTQEGADLVDLGAESTRPDARYISVEEELERLLPVLEGLSDLSVPISIDTYKAEVMRAALARGASMINDVRALQGEGALTAVRGFPVRRGGQTLGTVLDLVFAPAGALLEVVVETDEGRARVAAGPDLVVGPDALRPAI